MKTLRRVAVWGILLIPLSGFETKAQLGSFLENHFNNEESSGDQPGVVTTVTETPTVFAGSNTTEVEVIEIPVPIIPIPSEPQILTIGVAAEPADLSFSLGNTTTTIGGVVSTEPDRAKIVSPGSKVTLNLAQGFGAVSNVTWYRDEVVVASNQNSLQIVSFSSAHSGNYRASFAGDADYSTTDTIKLHAAVADQHRLINQSSRIKISPDSPQATFGFVLAPPVGGSFSGQRVLVRVIGPALADYDVSNPLSDPIYRLRDGEGNHLATENFTAIFIDGKSSEEHYRDEVNEASARVGAFPVESDLQSADTPRNLADLTQLTGGAYTVTVSSKSGGTGEVLVEIYEVPEE